MSISKVRLPNNTEEDIKAKYLIQSTSSDAVSAEFSARTVSEDAIANIQKIYGNTVKWNQLVQNGNFDGATSWSTINSTVTTSNHVATLVRGSQSMGGFLFNPSFSANTTHLYYIAATLSSQTSGVDMNYGFHTTSYTVGGNTILSCSTSSKQRVSGIVSPKNTTDRIAARIGASSSAAGSTGTIENAICVDLTMIYGAGSEPSVSEFEVQYPDAYYPYDPGSLTGNSATAILSRGFNQWDEEVQTASSAISSKNYIPAVGGATYYYKIPTGWLTVTEYDENKTQIGTAYSVNNATHSVASNCAYIKFITSSAYGSTYNHDICINISDPAKNGTYEPYNGHQIDLNIPTLTGKLNGAGSSVVIFPDGMNGVNGTADIITSTIAIKRYGMIDLGTLTWNTASGLPAYVYYSNLPSDAALCDVNSVLHHACNVYDSALSANANDLSDKTLYRRYTSTGTRTLYIKDTAHSTKPTSSDNWMSGVYMVYDLATPEEYILDNALQLQYPVVAEGTEMVLPTTGTAPMKMDVIYGNAADATSNLSSNFISVDSMKAFLNNLGTQMGGTWNMQYNNGKFEFTFSSS